MESVMSERKRRREARKAEWRRQQAELQAMRDRRRAERRAERAQWQAELAERRVERQRQKAAVRAAREPYAAELRPKLSDCMWPEYQAQNHARIVLALAEHCDRVPRELPRSRLRPAVEAYLASLHWRGLKPGTVTAAASCLRFYFREVVMTPAWSELPTRWPPVRRRKRRRRVNRNSARPNSPTSGAIENSGTAKGGGDDTTEPR